MSFAPKTESPALSPSTPDRRSTWQEAQAVPFGNGYIRVAPKWVSDRFNDHWSNGKTTGQAYCSVAGILCHGPIDYIQGIYAGGQLITYPNLTRPDDPEDPDYWSTVIEFGGVDADLGVSNRVRLYWGREDQPVDSWLQATSGQDHPPYRGQVVVVFERLHCGQIQAGSQQRPALPNIEFSLIRLVTPTVPSGLRLPDEIGIDRWRGVNLVSGLWDICTHPRAGLGLTAVELDEADWVAKAAALESGTAPAAGLYGSEAYVSPLLTGAAEAEKVMVDGLAYIDGWFYTIAGKIRVDWSPNDGSSPGALPEISEHDLVEPPRMRTGSLAEAPTSIVVECLEGDTDPHDLMEAAETASVPFVLQTTGETAVQKLQRPWFTSRLIASKYAARVASLATIPLMEGEWAVRLNRAVRLDESPLRVGDRFLAIYGPLQLSVPARLVERLETETKATLRWTRERGVSAQPYVPATDPRAPYELPDPPTPDAADWTVVEAPSGLSAGAASIALVRRPTDALSGARLYLDEDNDWSSGSTLLGTQGFAARVALDGAISDSAASCTLTGTDPDVSPFLGSGTTSAEAADDALVMLIGTEWVSLGAVSSAGPGAYTVALLRGRLGSIAAAHADAVIGWVIRRDRIILWTNAVFAQLTTRYFKVAYYHALADGPLSAAKSVTFADRAPASPGSLAATGLPGAIKLTWNNPSDPDQLGVQIYESATTTKPGSPSWFEAYPGNTFTRDDLAGGVTRYYWAEVVDQAGNVSAAAGPVHATTSSAAAGADGVGAWTPVIAGTATHSGGSVFKRTGSAAWDASIYSQEGYYRGAAMAAKCGALADVAFGLDAAPAASTANTTIDYGFRLWSGGQIDIVENGTTVAGSIGTQVANTTVFQVVYDNAAVRYYVDGVLEHTSTVAADQTLYLDSSLYTVDASNPLLTDVTFAAAGAAGAPGAGGLNTAVVVLYKRAATSPAVPTTTSTFTFSTLVLTGHDNGWTQAIPAVNGQPLWATAASASATGATDTIATGEWASPVKILEDGAAGLNTATVYLFQRAASAPSVPSGTTTYEFATGELTGGTIGSWTQYVPSGSNPCYVTTATAVGTGATDNIATGEWATPQILAQNGAPGATGPTGPTGSTGATGPGYVATSTSSIAIGTGSKSFTTQAGLAYVVGQPVRLIYTSDPAQFIEGAITAYTTGTGAMTVNATLYAGAGTYSSWTLSAVGQSGFGAIPAGKYVAGTVYYCNSVGQSVVTVGTSKYRAVNPAKNGLTTWGTPGSSSDWAAPDATYTFVAMGIALIDNATIEKTLIMGDGVTSDAGIHRSAGATAYGTGPGYYFNPRSSGHSNAAVGRIGNPSGYHIGFDGTDLRVVPYRMIVGDSGGTDDTVGLLQVNGEGSFRKFGSGAQNAGLTCTVAQGSASSPSATASGSFAALRLRGYDGSSFSTGGSLRLKAADSWNTDRSTEMELITGTTSANQYLYFSKTGKLEFGGSTATRDNANLYRGGANTVKTDGTLEAAALKQTYLEAGVTTAVDVKDVNLRIYNGGTQNARIDYTTGRYYVQGNAVLNTRWAGAAPGSVADLWAILQHHGLG